MWLLKEGSNNPFSDSEEEEPFESQDLPLVAQKGVAVVEPMWHRQSIWLVSGPLASQPSLAELSKTSETATVKPQRDHEEGLCCH